MQTALGRFTLTQLKLETQVKFGVELNLPYNPTCTTNKVTNGLEEEKHTYAEIVKKSLEERRQKTDADSRTPSPINTQTPSNTHPSTQPPIDAHSSINTLPPTHQPNPELENQPEIAPLPLGGSGTQNAQTASKPQRHETNDNEPIENPPRKIGLDD